MEQIREFSINNGYCTLVLKFGHPVQITPKGDLQLGASFHARNAVHGVSLETVSDTTTVYARIRKSQETAEERINLGTTKDREAALKWISHVNRNVYAPRKKLPQATFGRI